MLLHGAFTALLLLITVLSAEIVPPPTNVTVRCQNLQTTVHWEYSKQEPQTRFKVNIQGSAGKYEEETTDHQYDLSHFIWESENHYMGFHYVTVTAIQGGNQSKPVQSRTFTYNDVKTADITCKLDFPPVDLTVEGSGVTVSFQNPLHYYKKLKLAVKQGAPTFEFNVFNGTEFDGYCGMDQSLCREVILLPEGVKCVKLKGRLFEGNEVGQVPFRETDHICTSESRDVHVMTFVILLAIFVLIIIVITLIIYKVKAWTMKTPSLPKSLKLPPQKQRVEGYNVVSERDTSVAELIVHKPNKNPSVTSEEEIDPYGSLQDDNSVGSDLQPPARCTYMEGGLSERSNEDLGAAGLISGGHRTDDDSADDSVKTECVSLVSVEEERSPYDCPHIHIDMGDGDMALGYKK